MFTFNLNQAITEWRRQMTAGGVKRAAVLDELESHVREEVERQMRSGVEAQKAFETAVKKIGPASALKSEFRKVEAIKEERASKFINKLIVIEASVISLGMTGLVLSKEGAFSQMTSEEQLSGLAAVVVFSLFAWGGRLGYKIFLGIRVRRTRGAVVGSCAALLILWLMIFVYILLPRYNFSPGQLWLMMLWAFLTPMGVVFGLVGGIETARRKVTMTNS